MIAWISLLVRYPVLPSWFPWVFQTPGNKHPLFLFGRWTTFWLKAINTSHVFRGGGWPEWHQQSPNFQVLKILGGKTVHGQPPFFFPLTTQEVRISHAPCGHGVTWWDLANRNGAPNCLPFLPVSEYCHNLSYIFSATFLFFLCSGLNKGSSVSLWRP